MPRTVWAVVRGGRIEVESGVELPEGVPVLVTVLVDEDERFWTEASRDALDQIWDNSDDDVYGALLER